MKRKRSHQRRQPDSLFSWAQEQRCHPLCSCLSTFLLATSVILWIVAPLFRPEPVYIDQNLPVRERVRLRTNDSRAAHHGKTITFVENVADGVRDFVGGGLNNSRRQKKKNVEVIPEGCVPTDWQEYSFPNCNDVHDIDLWLTLVRSGKNSGKNNMESKLGYLDRGFWRSVWTVMPQPNMTIPVVLKMMLKKHDTDKRNFDRHRRDALVMERLTSSPNVVDIYGFCGNTVLTEYIPTPLDSILTLEWEEEDNGVVRMHKSKDKKKRSGPVTRETSKDRLNLALGVAKGIQALHEIHGGPIIHADIQARQFLVTPDGTVKVNDFNRCRFMAHRESSGEPCTVSIPSAPGKARAPEEYEKKPLDEKLDIYSVANVYHGILTGQAPYGDYSTKEVQRMVKRGIKPRIPAIFRLKGTPDEALAELTMKAYELDPSDRPSARELVAKIEKLLPLQS